MSAIINQILDRLVGISLNVHGTRAVQTLIEKLAFNVLEDHKNSQEVKSGAFLNHSNLMKVIGALDKEIVDLTMDMHGNHVVQSFLIIFKASDHPSDADLPGSDLTSQYTQFIFEACMANTL